MSVNTLIIFLPLDFFSKIEELRSGGDCVESVGKVLLEWVSSQPVHVISMVNH